MVHSEIVTLECPHRSKRDISQTKMQLQLKQISCSQTESSSMWNEVSSWLISTKSSQNISKRATGVVLQKKMLLKICKFHRNTTVLESFFNKVERPKTCNFFKKRLPHSRFPLNLVNLRKAYFEEHLWTIAPDTSRGIIELKDVWYFNKCFWIF